MRQTLTDACEQFFCKMVMSAFRDVDVLVVPVQRAFPFASLPDLLTNEGSMNKFLEFGYSESSRREWEKRYHTEWEDTHEEIGKALQEADLKGASARRGPLLQGNGVMEVFAEAYVALAMPPADSEQSELRDVHDSEFTKRMRAYTDRVVESVGKTLAIRRELEVGSWEAQILSKIRYLTSPRGKLAPKPFLCLEYLMDIVHEWAMTPAAVKEVSIFNPNISFRAEVEAHRLPEHSLALARCAAPTPS